MRLWHKDLISYLPRKQLVAQWRECCCICRNLAINGTPNHILVNKIIYFDILHFTSYVWLILDEFKRRNYNISKTSFDTFNFNLKQLCGHELSLKRYPIKQIYQTWHNERYLKQCLFNLQEKFDCGGIPKDEKKRKIFITI